MMCVCVRAFVSVNAYLYVGEKNTTSLKYVTLITLQKLRRYFETMIQKFKHSFFLMLAKELFGMSSHRGVVNGGNMK